MRKLFNFNNEVDTFEIDVNEETGRVEVPGPNGVTAEYDSLLQLAEIYAQARDVLPENLKNWTLLENGDVVSFVLRAGTAGVSAEMIQEDLDAVLGEIRTEGAFHPLHVQRVAQELEGCENVVNTLAMSQAGDVAREVYDRLDARGAFEETTAEPELEPVDERSELERYLDKVMEEDKSIGFFARLLNLGTDADKASILAGFNASTIPYTVEMLCSLYENALNAARDGMNVDTRFDALLVMTQEIPNEVDVEAKTKLAQVTVIAGRNQVNVSVYEVGRQHIRKSTKLVRLAELDGENVIMVGNKPVIISFNPEVDAALEAERAEALAQEEADRSSAAYDEYEDEYENEDYDYSEDEDEDEDEYEDEEGVLK